MTSAKTRAYEAEAEDRFEDAAILYEGILIDDGVEMSTMLNLAILYWQSIDPGVSVSKRPSPAFVQIAGIRLFKLLEEMLCLFPQSIEVLFWYKYIRWADLGESLLVLECVKMLNYKPDFLDPAVFIFPASNGQLAKSEAMALLRECQNVGMSRCRYIESVLTAAFKRMS